MGKKIICPSCGAECDDELAKCPYCDSVIIKGAEKEYMEKLEEVKQDLHELENDAGEEIKAVAKKQGKMLWKLLLVVCVIVIAAVGISKLIDQLIERTTAVDYRQTYLWKQEYFPKFDAMYEQNDLRGMVELYYTTFDDKTAVVYEWEHFYFLSDLMGLCELSDYLEQEKQHPLDEYQLKEVFYLEWSTKGCLEQRERLTEEEYEKLRPLIEQSEKDFDERWHISEEDYAIYYQQLKDNYDTGILYSSAGEYVKKWIKENQ